MSSTGERKLLLFVINPKAGSRLKRKINVSDLITKFCIRNSYSYDFYYTTGINDHHNIKILLDLKTFDAAVAVGGDGTVHLLATLLVHKEIPLGIIPQGSANGLAKDLKIPDDAEEALKIISRFKSFPIDTLKINDIDCFHLSDIGFNARIIHRFAESVVRGKISYLWYGLMEFFTVKSFPYKIVTPAATHSGNCFMMIITNTKQFGTEVIINPLGKMDDGFFEIIIIKPFSRWSSFDVFHKLITNNLHRSQYSQLVKCNKAEIFNFEEESLHIDGEPEQAVALMNISVVPKGLKVLSGIVLLPDFE